MVGHQKVYQSFAIDWKTFDKPRWWYQCWLPSTRSDPSKGTGFKFTPTKQVLCFQFKGQLSNPSFPSFTILFCPHPTLTFYWLVSPPPSQLVSFCHSHSLYLNLFNHGCICQFVLINSWPFSVQRKFSLVAWGKWILCLQMGLVNSVLNLSDGQVKFLGEFKLPKKKKPVIIPVHQKNFWAS